MTPLLVRLHEELLAATDSTRRDELQAKLAIALARSGRFAEAAERIAKLRENRAESGHGPGTLWVMLAEGVLALYEEMGPSALDRITRVQLLAKALNLTNLIRLASAWKAHIQFEVSEFERMIESLAIVAAHQDPDDLDSVTRFSMVLANAHSLCGDFNASQQWFMRGRDSAIKNGDRVSIEALQYNKAALRLAWLRVENCRSAIGQSDLRSMRTEIGSCLGFQQLMSVGAYANHLQLCEARLLVMEKSFDQALDRLEKVRRLSPFAVHNFSQDLINIEVAYCYANSGDLDKAISIINTSNLDALEQHDIDERVVAQWMRWKMTQIDSRFGESNECSSALTELLNECDDLRARMRRTLQSLPTLCNPQ